MYKNNVKKEKEREWKKSERRRNKKREKEKKSFDRQIPFLITAVKEYKVVFIFLKFEKLHIFKDVLDPLSLWFLNTRRKILKRGKHKVIFFLVEILLLCNDFNFVDRRFQVWIPKR